MLRYIIRDGEIVKQIGTIAPLLGGPPIDSENGIYVWQDIAIVEEDLIDWSEGTDANKMLHKSLQNVYNLTPKEEK